jgi:hypothetical protein
MGSALGLRTCSGHAYIGLGVRERGGGHRPLTGFMSFNIQAILGRARNSPLVYQVFCNVQ